MKICMLAFSFPQNKDDAQCRFIYLLARELAKKHEVHVVTSGGKKTKDEELMEGIHVHRFNYFLPKKWQIVTYGSSMAQILKSNPLSWLQFPSFMANMFAKTKKIGSKCDIIHAQFSYLALFPFMAGLKKPIIVTCRGADISTSLNNKILFALNKKLLKKCDYITTVSDDLRKTLILKYKISENKIKFIPNGVETKLFMPLNKENTRKELKLPQNKKIVLFVGHIIVRKGLDYLVDAAKLIIKKHKDILFLVIGKGNQEQKIRKLVQKYNISENFVFLGTKPHKTIAKYMVAADILTLPSLSEGRANVLYEALAAGLPIVATAVCGTPELIKDGKNGFLVPPKNSAKLAEKIDKLLNNNKIRALFSKNGIKFIKESGLSWENTAKEYEKIYEKVKR